MNGSMPHMLPVLLFYESFASFDPPVHLTVVCCVPIRAFHEVTIIMHLFMTMLTLSLLCCH